MQKLKKYITKMATVHSTKDTRSNLVDVGVFNISAQPEATAEKLKKLVAENHVGSNGLTIDPFDGEMRSYKDLGKWLGSEGLSLQFMGLADQLGLIKVTSPRMVSPDISEKNHKAAMEAGMVCYELAG